MLAARERQRAAESTARESRRRNTDVVETSHGADDYAVRRPVATHLQKLHPDSWISVLKKVPSVVPCFHICFAFYFFVVVAFTSWTEGKQFYFYSIYFSAMNLQALAGLALC